MAAEINYQKLCDLKQHVYYLRVWEVISLK